MEGGGQEHSERREKRTKRLRGLGAYASEKNSPVKHKSPDGRQRREKEGTVLQAGKKTIRKRPHKSPVRSLGRRGCREKFWQRPACVVNLSTVSKESPGEKPRVKGRNLVSLGRERRAHESIRKVFFSTVPSAQDRRRKRGECAKREGLRRMNIGRLEQKQHRPRSRTQGREEVILTEEKKGFWSCWGGRAHQRGQRLIPAVYEARTIKTPSLPRG